MDGFGLGLETPAFQRQTRGRQIHTGVQLESKFLFASLYLGNEALLDF